MTGFYESAGDPNYIYTPSAKEQADRAEQEADRAQAAADSVGSLETDLNAAVTSAASSATIAETAKVESADSANDSLLSATEARHWANTAVDQLVVEGDQVDDYSALHHATKAKASETNAAASASNALSSANSASSSEANALVSKNNAATSALNAADSETNAATSAQEAADEVASIDKVDLKSGRKNLIINGNFSINQRAFGGGQPAVGVYGYDRWKGDAAGTRIEQVVENTDSINDSFVISWAGGTGTATVNGVTGLNSGDTFTLNAGSDFSVIVPTDATKIQLEKGSYATDFEYRPIADELALCQRYYQIITESGGSSYAVGSGAIVGGNIFDFAVDFITPIRSFPAVSVSSIAGGIIASLGYYSVTSFNSVRNFSGTKLGIRMNISGGVAKDVGCWFGTAQIALDSEL